MLKKLIISLLLMFSLNHNAHASFPVNGVLASFTCANSTTAPCPSASWTKITNFDGTGDTAGISSNQAYNVTANNGLKYVWNPNSFTGTIEVYATLSVLPSGGQSSGVAFSTGKTATGNDSYLITIDDSGNGHIYKTVDSSGTYTSIKTFTVAAVSNGDSIGATRTSGGVITAWYEHSGSWVQETTVTDTTYSVSYIAFTDLGGNSAVRWTNFGGGTESAGAVNHGFTWFMR